MDYSASGSCERLVARLGNFDNGNFAPFVTSEPLQNGEVRGSRMQTVKNEAHYYLWPQGATGCGWSFTFSAP